MSNNSKSQSLRPSKLELSKFYSDQRDSQLRQLMAISGQGTFTVLAALGAIILGVLSLEDSKFDFGGIKIFVYLIFSGIIVLLISAPMFSISYNRRITFFEKQIRDPKQLDQLEDKNFVIRPNKVGSNFIFVGILLILIGTFGIVIKAMETTPAAQ